VTGHEAWQVFLRQNGKCALTGLDLDFGSGGTDRRNYHLGSASLDRIDSAKGYSLDNIQWVHKQVNLMKSDLDQSEFIRWCKRVARHSVAATVSLAGSLQPTAPAD
jgi:hypothetical protein